MRVHDIVVLLFLFQWACVFTCDADNATNSDTDGDNIYQSFALLENQQILKYSARDGATLSIGYCMTHEEDVGISIARCPDYYQLEGHNAM